MARPHLQQLLCLSLLLALFQQPSVQAQRANQAPRFRTTNGIDGDLRHRLQAVGIKENTPKYTYIGDLKAYDPDCEAGPPTCPLEFDAITKSLSVLQNGSVYLLKDLDRESSIIGDDQGGELLKVKFRVYDGFDAMAEAEIVINVVDVNDNPPEFLGLPYRTSVAENAKVGSTIFRTITVKDKDKSEYSRIGMNCTIISDNPESADACNTFDVQYSLVTEGLFQASLTLKRLLDYENKTQYIMSLQVWDNPNRIGTPMIQNTQTVNVLVKVEDRQDSPPTFVSAPIAMFPNENTTIGDSIGIIQAYDMDIGNPNPISFRIIPNSAIADLFTLGPATANAAGVYRASVLLNAKLDYEKGVRYDFEVEAIEMENGQETNARARTTVTIDVLDINDNIPTFKKTIYKVSVPENQHRGSRLPNLNIVCEDFDATTYAQFKVSMLPSSSDTFYIRSDTYDRRAVVDILVGIPEKMDYEVPSNRNQKIYLEAQPTMAAIGNPSRTEVEIILIDENDNFPIFTRSDYSFSVREDVAVGTTLFRDIKANDADSDENGRITYHLPTPIFIINQTTGYITLGKSLDYETIREHQFLLQAFDHGEESLTGYSILKVIVLDFNDIGPVFMPSSYKTEINEKDNIFNPGPPIQVKASDPDTGLSDAITFRIISGNTQDDAFQIDPRTGQLTLIRGLTYMSDGTTLTLTIEASDNDKVNPQTSLTTVTVQINDINDHSPEFPQSLYTKIISESEPSGFHVTTVLATDQDFGSNKIIRYSILGGSSDHFNILSDNGSIHVSGTNKLDYDEKKEYEIIINAIDEGSPPHTGTTTVSITLTDANNKNPYFEQQLYYRSIDEGEDKGFSILQVEAKDPDQGYALRYSIPDRFITARDGNGQLLRNLFEYNYKDAWRIDELTGQIYTNKVLQRREAAWYDFAVMATDINGDTGRTQTGTTSVAVTVLGSIDSAPYFGPPWSFDNPEYRQTIREGIQKGVKIIALTAYDPSNGDSQLKNYEFVLGSHNQYFRLDRQTGDIYVNKDIDYEKLDFATLSVRVKATTDPVVADIRTATALLTITVQDVNDNAPVFTKSHYDFTVRESFSYPQTVGLVRAEDSDSGRYGQIAYELNGQGAEAFRIYDDGVIIISSDANLDHETKKQYNLLVTALDNPKGLDTEEHQQATVTLTITVTDENDHAPQFTESRYDFYTVESTPPGSSIGALNTVDADSGTNAVVSYYMQSADQQGRNLFSVGLDDGVIYTNSDLRGRAISSPYKLTIRAQDQGFPTLSSTSIVVVSVSSGQLNDGTPVFTQPTIGHIVTTVCETQNATGDEVVFKVYATARSDNAEVDYSIMTGINDVSDYFDIKPMVGADAIKYGLLTFQKGANLDREVKEKYEVLIVATDSTNATLKSYRQLEVKLCDLDDKKPSFFCNGIDESYATVQVTEDVPIGYSVYEVSACDGDLPPNNAVRYRFHFSTTDDKCPSVHDDYFKLNFETGKIYTESLLDREVHAQHKLCIVAYTPVNVGKRQAQFKNDQIFYLTIIVMDRNDNAPSLVTSQVDSKLLKVIFEFPEDDFITQIVAVDPDEPPYDRVRYLLSSIRFFDPTEEEFIPVPGAFLINPDKGIITTGFKSYRPFTNGYFLVVIKAEDYYDSLLYNTVTVRVFVTQQRSRIRVVLKKAADDAQQDANKLLELFNTNSKDSFYIKYAVTYHRTSDAEYDYTRTDVCFTILNRPNKDTEYTVLNSYRGTKLVKENYASFLSSVESVDVGPCDPETTNNIEGWSALWWVLVAFAIFIFVCVFIFIVVICHLHNNYKNFMHSAKTYLVQN